MATKLTDNSPQVAAAINAAIEKALVQIGEQAEGYAKAYITQQHAVDTGLLRNSVTYALGGQPPAISSYTDEKGAQSRTYGGTAPADTGDQRSVYIGTHVEYAPYIEYGTYRMAARPFIRPTVTDHEDEYKLILETEIKEATGNP